MPEITIDKNGNALAVEHHIGTAWQRANVTRELSAMPTQFTLNESLKRAVLQFDRLHGPRPLLRREVVAHVHLPNLDLFDQFLYF